MAWVVQRLEDMSDATMQYRAWWMANGVRTFGEWRASYDDAADDMYEHEGRRGVQNSDSAADPDAALARVVDRMV